jgi:hypothetical protein
MRILPLRALLLAFDGSHARGIKGRAPEADCFEFGGYRSPIVFSRRVSLIAGSVPASTLVPMTVDIRARANADA